MLYYCQSVFYFNAPNNNMTVGIILNVIQNIERADAISFGISNYAVRCIQLEIPFYLLILSRTLKYALQL